MALDDAPNAKCPRAERGFKPNCLGIQNSIQIHLANAERGSEIQTEHVLPAQSSRLLIGSSCQKSVDGQDSKPLRRSELAPGQPS